MKNKIILFGGTFDPIHCGHTFVARYALEKINAQRVIFIPAKRSPHKSERPKVSDNIRIEMISLAIRDESVFELSECELKRSEPSYTIDTIRTFKSKYGQETQLYWLVGADAVKDLGKWYKIKELVDLCDIAVVFRAGFKKPDFSHLQGLLRPSDIEKLLQSVISAPLIDISSSEIKQKLAQNEDISQMVAPQIKDYILKNNLYRSNV